MMYAWLETIYQQLIEYPQAPQALCIIAPHGRGKALLAECYAQFLLNTQQLSIHPDFLHITTESSKSIGIDTVRDIQDFCFISPTRAQFKVVLINAVDALTVPAQQAFLKTVEEPAVPTHFILLCHEASKMLPTLRSRCQVITLPSVPYVQAQAWMASQGVRLNEQEYALTDDAPLLAISPEFEVRKLSYQLLKDYFHKKTWDGEAVKGLLKSDPLSVLTGFYYALMQAGQFVLLDHCIALRKQYSENPNLNWEMQCQAFIVKVKTHAI